MYYRIYTTDLKLYFNSATLKYPENFLSHSDRGDYTSYVWPANQNGNRFCKPRASIPKTETQKHPAFYQLTCWQSDNYISGSHPALELNPANLHRLRQLLSKHAAPQLPLTIPAPSLVPITLFHFRAQTTTLHSIPC